ncbi:unnamed protein product [Penicillium salamii]|nr:unnamed protein product [Penicillium salamii]CAG8416139.1 unnamed protein product [Penicillium salamii]
MHFKRVLLGVCLTAVSVLAGQSGSSSSHNAASDIDEYCFYTIYTTLSEYTFKGSVTISSDATQGSTAYGSSSDTSNGNSTSSNSSVTVTPHEVSHRSLAIAKRGHHGSSGTATGPCNSTIEVTSLYASAKAWCSAKGLRAAIPYWQSLCSANSLTLMDLTDIEAELTDDYITSLPLIDPEQNSMTTTGTINSPVLLSHAYYEKAYKSYVRTGYSAYLSSFLWLYADCFSELTHDFAIAKDKTFGWGIMGYWASVLVLGMISKACVTLQGGSQKRTPLESLCHLWRTHLTVPATFAPFSSKHQQLWYSHAIPKRVDSLIVCGFWIVTIFLNCVNYESFTGNIQTPSLWQQTWQYTSDRTGILSYACLPFLWLFSGRNNVFLWATNFNNQSFITFHRHVAWACTLLAVVHSINYSVVFAVYDGRYWSVWVQEYWYMGVVATILMCFMLVQSMTWFRQHSYEIFLAIHLIFAVVVIVGLFIFDGQEFVGYLWSPVGLWIIDRLARLFRIVYCNLNVRFGKNVFSGSHSTVTFNEESDLIKIEVIPGISTSPKPGQHYFIYQGGVLKFWENHPFSLGAWTTAAVKSEDRSPATEESKLIFYIRPYDGWTRRLRDQCRKAGAAFHPNLVIEGPYGHAEPMHYFDTNLIVVGGTGIAAAVPYLLSHLGRVKRRQTKTSRIHLVWSIRQREMCDQVFTDDLQQILRCNDIKITVYCTKLEKTLQRFSPDGFETKDIVSATAATPVDSPSNGVRLMPGRPNVAELLTAEVEESKASASSLGVLTCGPAQMADECRSSVYKAMKHGFHAIDYFEEAFGW